MQTTAAQASTNEWFVVLGDMKFVYDLSVKIASSDYFTWLVLAKAAGAKEVVFRIDRGVKTDKWPRERVMRRLETFLMPGTALAGLPCSIGTGGYVPPWGSTNRDLQQYAKSGQKFERLKSILPPGNARYTVTLRNDYRIPEKNSNEPAWRQFAEEIGAAVIGDYDDVFMHPHEIMALYAGAEMNFGVNSGQFWLCALSPYPYMVFDTCDKGEHPDTAHRGTIKFYFPKNGLPIGEKWAWFNEHQHVVWEPDTIEVLHKNFEKWQKKSEAA